MWLIEEEDEVRYPLLSTAQEADQVTGILVVLPGFKHESLVEGDAAFPTSLASLTSAFAAGFMSANEPESWEGTGLDQVLCSDTN